MPHLTLLYTSNLEEEPAIEFPALCRQLCDAMLSVRDETGRQVFPTGGVRVLAYPAKYFAVADGKHAYAFLYLNLRMGRGRSAAVKQQAGDAILAAAKAHLEQVFATRLVGLTLQIDEGQEVFDAKHSTIHPLFKGT